MYQTGTLITGFSEWIYGKDSFLFLFYFEGRPIVVRRIQVDEDYVRALQKNFEHGLPRGYDKDRETLDRHCIEGWKDGRMLERWRWQTTNQYREEYEQRISITHHVSVDIPQLIIEKIRKDRAGEGLLAVLAWTKLMIRGYLCYSD